MGDKLLIYNEAGWELGQRNTAPMSVEDVERCSVDKVAGTGVGIYQLCLLTGHVAALHRSSILEPYASALGAPHKMYVWRMRETMRSLRARGTDVLKVVVARCRAVGIEPHASIRVNDPHHIFRSPPDRRGEIKYRHEYLFPDLRSPWIDAHPELWLPDGNFDFAHDEVRARKLAVIAEVLDNYDLDGLELDFTRMRPFFKDGEKERGIPLMTAWVEDVRRLVERKARRGRPVRLTIRVEYEPEVNLAEGLDVEAWVRAGLVDIVCLGVTGDFTPDAPADWFIRRCAGTGCLVCPSLEGFFYWMGGSFGTDETITPEHARAAAATYYLAGADGLQLYNFCAVDRPYDRRILDELGRPERIAFADKQYVFTLCPAPLFRKRDPWESRFVLRHEAEEAAIDVRLGDDFARASALGLSPRGLLKLQLDGLNRLDDVLVTLNGVPLTPRPETENIFAWDSFSVDVVCYDVPTEALRQGENRLALRRLRRYPDYVGHIEVQGCELGVRYPRAVPASSLA